MQKVDLSTWGGSKVRANLKKIWPLGGLPASADTDMATYQTSLSSTIQNTNELIDEVEDIRRILARRPF